MCGRRHTEAVGQAPEPGAAGISPEPAGDGKEPLDEEIAFYVQHLPEWRDHQGEHVLIHGQEPHGFYPTRDEALLEGFRRFGRASFLVKQVLLDERPRPLAGVIL